jgi:LiaF transmembrane domain
MKRMLWWGIVLVVVGLWIWLSALRIPYMVFSRDWPLLVVALGVYIVVRRLQRRIRRRRNAGSVITDLEAGRIDVDKAISEIRRSR